MTPVYEVRTKHTKEVLKDFIAFREAVKKAHVDFRLFMLGVCSVTVAIMARDMKGFLYTFSVLAILFFGFLLIRKPLALSKLEKADENYQRQSELYFMFGESGFRVTNEDIGDEKRFKYGDIAFMYSDSKYYYINTNNEDLHMLPAADFVLGDPADFKEFVEHKTNQTIQPVKLPWRVKWGIIKQAWAMRMQEDAEELNGKGKKKEKK